MPFLQNTWYMFGHAHEVTTDSFLNRTIADVDLLVYRKTDGTLAALHDLCPHRFVPLHKGKQIGDAIQCGYHGLEFGSDGQCVKHPVTGAQIPKTACVQSYPVVERDTLIWVWPGNADRADASLIPDYSFLTQPDRRNVGGYLHTLANYQLSSDNLLDLSHVQFVHSSMQASEAFERSTFRVEQEGEEITTYLTLPNGLPPPLYRTMLDPGTPLDITFEMRWNLPSCIRLRMTGTAVGKPEEQLFQTMSAHVVSPETASTSHYFYINSRTTDLDNPEADATIRNWQEQGFTQEDKPMLEAQQRYIGDRDLMSLNPAGLKTDAGAVRARRILAERIANEPQIPDRLDTRSYA